LSQNNSAKNDTIKTQTGGYPNGIIQGRERTRFLHAADAAQQNIDVDRIAGCLRGGLLLCRPLHDAQQLISASVWVFGLLFPGNLNNAMIKQGNFVFVV
jgi:hypothetical protein